MWFGKYGLENNVLKAIEGGRAAFDLHTENCAFPRSQEEFGEIHRIEPRIDFTGGLRLGDARSKRSTPFLEYCSQPRAQEFALRALKTEIADQATAIPFVVCQHAANNVQIPLQSLPGGKGLVFQSLFDESLEVSKVAVQYFLGKRLLGTEVIGEGAQRNLSGFADIAYARARVSRSEHHLEAGAEKVFAKRWFAHDRNNTYVRIICQGLFHSEDEVHLSGPSGLTSVRRNALLSANQASS